MPETTITITPCRQLKPPIASEGGFARAVVTREGDALARLDGECEIVEQDAGTEFNSKGLQLEGIGWKSAGGGDCTSWQRVKIRSVVRSFKIKESKESHHRFAEFGRVWPSLAKGEAAGRNLQRCPTLGS